MSAKETLIKVENLQKYYKGGAIKALDGINTEIKKGEVVVAQVLLKHSNLMVYQIADELNFPNPSFFCKFFKRRTGMTPQEYQKR